MQKSNKEIGGYFSLELPEQKRHYHQNALHLNSARNALEYLLKNIKPKKVYIPYYNCDVMIEPFLKTQTDYEYYAINQNLEIENVSPLQENEYILYINYFGIKDQYVRHLIKRYREKLIIDNCQAFFSKFTKVQYAFYSPRKFFGVPDGGYLVGCFEKNLAFEPDSSVGRMSHLIGRMESDAFDYYDAFRRNDDSLIMQDIKQMSKITETILSGLNYKKIAQRRNENFLYLHEQLHTMNLLAINANSIKVPMVYPFLLHKKLKKILIKHKIYVATYWENVLSIENVPEAEKFLTENLIPLPIDQRYTVADMQKIVAIIKENHNV